VPEALFPLDDDSAGNADLGRRLDLADAIRPVENDPRPAVFAVSHCLSVHDGAQFTLLFGSDCQRFDRSCHIL
jgi:hypothetical protein